MSNSVKVNIDNNMVKDAAVFANMIYENAENLDGSVKEAIKADEIHSSFQIIADSISTRSAIFINPDLKIAYFAIKGSQDFWNDVVINDFLGYFGLLGNTPNVLKDNNALLIKQLQDQGYIVVITGHSLGGSIARLLCQCWNGVYAITFNSPYLKHDRSIRSDPSNSCNILNVKNDKDIVWKIASPSMANDADFQSSITCNGVSISPTGAHSMTELRNADFNSCELRTVKILSIESENLFFDVVKVEVTEVVDGRQVKDEFLLPRLSNHSIAAIDSAFVTLLSTAINDLMKTKRYSLIKDYAIPVGYSAAHAFVTSVINGKLAALHCRSAFAKNISSSGATLVTAFMSGSKVNVEKILVHSAISTVLGEISRCDLIGFGDFASVSQRRLLSSRSFVELINGKSIDCPIPSWPGISFGTHVSSGYGEYELRDGRKQTDIFSEKGCHLDIIGTASAAFAVRNGRSTTEPRLTKNADGSTSAHCTHESYSGKFVLGFKLVDLCVNIQLLPSFESHTVDYYVTFNEDNSPLKSTKTVNSSQTFEFNRDVYIEASSDHLEVLELLVQDLFESAGTEEHVMSSATHVHKKRRFFFFKKTWTDYVEEGYGTKSSVSACPLRQTNDEHATQLSCLSENYEFIVQNGKRTEVDKGSGSSTKTLFTKVDGSTYEERQTITSDYKGSEKDIARLEITDGLSSTSKEIRIGRLMQQSPEVKTFEKIDSGHVITSTSSRREGMYFDTIELTEAGSITTLKSGEDRKLSGIDQKLTHVETRERDGYLGMSIKLSNQVETRSLVETTSKGITSTETGSLSSTQEVTYQESHGIFTASFKSGSSTKVIGEDGTEECFVREGKSGIKLTSHSYQAITHIFERIIAISPLVYSWIKTKDPKVWAAIILEVKKLSSESVENFLISICGQVAATTKNTGDGLLPSILITITMAVVRELMLESPSDSSESKTWDKKIEGHIKSTWMALKHAVMNNSSRFHIIIQAIQFSIVYSEYFGRNVTPVLFLLANINDICKSAIEDTTNKGIYAHMWFHLGSALPLLTSKTFGAYVSWLGVGALTSEAIVGAGWAAFLTSTVTGGVCLAASSSVICVGVSWSAYWLWQNGSRLMYQGSRLLYNDMNDPEIKEYKQLLCKYFISGIPSKEETDKLRRRLSTRFHPDIGSGSKEASKEAFQEFANDFDRIKTLNEKIIVKFDGSKFISKSSELLLSYSKTLREHLDKMKSMIIEKKNLSDDILGDIFKWYDEFHKPSDSLEDSKG